MDDRLALSVTHSDGKISRWGPDGPKPTDIPGDLTFSTSIPGGFKDLQCSLLRDIDIDYNDQGLFDQVRLYGTGNRTAWEGRMAQFPRSHGDGFSITPGAVGWSSHLEDYPAFREIYVDRDLSSWAEPSVQRRLALISAGFAAREQGIVADTTTGQPSLRTGWTGPWGSSSGPDASSLYDKGIPIGSVYYAWKKTGTVNEADTNWNWDVQILSTDTFTTSDTSGTLRATGPGTGTVTGTGTKKFANARLYYNTGTTAGADGAEYAIYWTCLAVYGAHGLTKQGTESATTAKGFYASDVIRNIVTRAAPLLSIGQIDATTFVIPHLAFTDPTKASDAVATVNAYHLYDWGVYDNREFFYRAPDPDRLTWQARLSEGAQLDLEGDAGAQVFNGVLVSYTDPLGQRRLAGPPAAYWSRGVALADSTNAALADTSATNPVNEWGFQRWGELSIGITTTAAGAEAIGAAWLAERLLAQRRGSLTLTGTATHPTEGKVPVWRVRAGDYVSIADHPASVPRRIIETKYTHANRSVTCTLDNTNFKTESILERLGVQLVGVL